MDVQPVRIAVSSDGVDLFVVGLFEYRGPRVIVYDTRMGRTIGRFVSQMPSAKGVHSAGYPDCLAVSGGYFFYTPAYPYIVRKFTLFGALAGEIVGNDRGFPGPRKDKFGLTFCPFVVGDIAVDHSGRLVVLLRWARQQRVGWSIDVFTPDGRQLCSIPSKLIDADALATCIATGEGGRLYVGFTSPYPKLCAVDLLPLIRNRK